MSSKYKHLPPLTALRAFEAAARQSSFKLAANELCITPAAISRQIKQLEQRLSKPLFVRSHRRVELSCAGQDLFAAVNSAFIQLDSVSKGIQYNNADNYLNLQLTSSFAQLWLIPKLPALRQHTSLHLNLTTVESNPKVSAKFEAAITLGLEDDSNYFADFLFSEEITCVCSPGFLLQNPQLINLESLTKLPLLDLEAHFWSAKLWSPLGWKVWLEEQNIDHRKITVDMNFSHYPMLIEAVLQGLGVGLGWHHLVADMLASGRLVRPLDVSLKALQRRHYFVYRKDLIESVKIQTLRRWLLAQTAVLRQNET